MQSTSKSIIFAVSIFCALIYLFYKNHSNKQENPRKDFLQQLFGIKKSIMKNLFQQQRKLSYSYSSGRFLFQETNESVETKTSDPGNAAIDKSNQAANEEIDNMKLDMTPQDYEDEIKGLPSAKTYNDKGSLEEQKNIMIELRQELANEKNFSPGNRININRQINYRINRLNSRTYEITPVSEVKEAYTKFISEMIGDVNDPNISNRLTCSTADGNVKPKKMKAFLESFKEQTSNAAAKITKVKSDHTINIGVGPSQIVMMNERIRYKGNIIDFKGASGHLAALFQKKLD